MKYTIYSVEDDPNIAHLIKVTMQKQGYEIMTFPDGEQFLAAIKMRKPNMILLDMMLPGISGTEVLKYIRNDNNYDDVEIIILSANTMLMSKIDSLDLGADDYIEKPFNVLELMSRIQAKVRRFQRFQEITIQDICLNLDACVCYKKNEPVSLTTKEFEILSILFKNKGKLVTREQILQAIWGQDAILETRTVDMHIKSLRKKLGDEKHQLIDTVHGLGYRVSS